MIKYGFSFALTIIIMTVSQSAAIASSSYENLANSLLAKIDKGKSLAVQQINPKEFSISANTARLIDNEIMSALSVVSSEQQLTLIDRARFKDIMREREEFMGEEDFTNLVKKAGASVLISPSISKNSNGSLGLALRATGITGEATGQVIGATSTLTLDIPVSFSVKIGSVVSGSEQKDRYRDAISVGVSKVENITISESSDLKEIDFILSSEYEYSVSRSKTQESREAEQGAKAFGQFSKMFGVMGGGNNPLGNMQGLGPSADDAKNLEKINISVSVISTAENVVLKSKKQIRREEVVSLPGDASLDSQKTALRQKINQLIAQSVSETLSLSMGKSLPQEKIKKDSLD